MTINPHGPRDLNPPNIMSTDPWTKELITLPNRRAIYRKITLQTSDLPSGLTSSFDRIKTWMMRVLPHTVVWGLTTVKETIRQMKEPSLKDIQIVWSRVIELINDTLDDDTPPINPERVQIRYHDQIRHINIFDLNLQQANLCFSAWASQTPHSIIGFSIHHHQLRVIPECTWKVFNKNEDELVDLQEIEFDVSNCNRLLALPDFVCTYNKIARYLTSINLEGCKLITALPNNISNAKNISDINLNRTGICAIPDCLFRLEQEAFFDLKNMRNLSRLPNLAAPDNHLQYLVLSENHALRSLPINFHRWHVIELEIKDCHLPRLQINSGLPTSMKVLDLRGATGINDYILFLSSHPNLEQLILDGSDFSGFPEDFILPPKLSKITMARCLRYNNSVPEHFFSHKHLKDVVLVNNKAINLKQPLEEQGVTYHDGRLIF
jgi:hypothetical protein